MSGDRDVGLGDRDVGLGDRDVIRSIDGSRVWKQDAEDAEDAEVLGAGVRVTRRRPWRSGSGSRPTRASSARYTEILTGSRLPLRTVPFCVLCVCHLSQSTLVTFVVCRPSRFSRSSPMRARPRPGPFFSWRLGGLSSPRRATPSRRRYSRVPRATRLLALSDLPRCRRAFRRGLWRATLARGGPCSRRGTRSTGPYRRSPSRSTC